MIPIKCDAILTSTPITIPAKWCEIKKEDFNKTIPFYCHFIIALKTEEKRTLKLFDNFKAHKNCSTVENELAMNRSMSRKKYC